MTILRFQKIKKIAIFWFSYDSKVFMLCHMNLSFFSDIIWLISLFVSTSPQLNITKICKSKNLPTPTWHNDRLSVVLSFSLGRSNNNINKNWIVSKCSLSNVSSHLQFWYSCPTLIQWFKRSLQLIATGKRKYPYE